MLSRPGILLVLLAVVVAWLAIHADFSPAPVKEHPADTSFSVPRAFAHLQKIAAKPHSIGTSANQQVRDYILSRCDTLGLTTRTRHSTSVISLPGGVTAGEVTNIIAVCKGSDSLRKARPHTAVLVMAHYDSEPNTPGAGDDGAGCAAMLETARLIVAGHRLQNDIIFLFTDGEEAGLFGSASFVREDSLFDAVGVVLNFDGRGNAGNQFMISNGSSSWMVKEYDRACAHKSASSLYHELFRILPNSTDLLPFSRKNIPGLDFAYIDGFVNYHAMTDQPANMDRNTLQDLGDNMLSLVKHFGNIDIPRQKGGEDTFFTAIGNWMILYPVGWNMGFLILTNILLLAWLVTGMLNRRIDWKGFLAGLLSFVLTLAILYFATSWVLQGLRKAYPLYMGYYSNAYNSKYFYFSVITLVIALFGLVFQGVLRRFEWPSLMAGILLLETALLDLLYTTIPTAVYFLCFPILFVLAACIIGHSRRRTTPVTGAGWQTPTLIFISGLPALLLLAPLIYGLFIGFDLQELAAALGPLTGLLLGLLLPLLAQSFRESRWFIPGTSFLLCLLAAGFGVLHRQYSSAKPYKTNLRYVVNTNDSAAYWVLRHSPVDAWNRKFFSHPGKGQMGYTFGSPAEEVVNTAEFVNFSAPEITIKHDTVVNGRRQLLVHCLIFDSAVSAHWDLDSTSPASAIAVNGIRGEDSANHRPLQWLDVRGRWPEGFDVLFETDTTHPFTFHALSRIMGLPGIQGFQGYPLEMIPGPGLYSNTTMASEYYSFKYPLTTVESPAAKSKDSPKIKRGRLR